MNEGLPAAASSSPIKTYKLASLVDLGVRRGSSFGGYTRTGTLSNNLFTGAGIENRFLTLLACLWKELEPAKCGGLSPVDFSSFSSSGGIGKRDSDLNACEQWKMNKSLKLPGT